MSIIIILHFNSERNRGFILALRYNLPRNYLLMRKENRDTGVTVDGTVTTQNSKNIQEAGTGIHEIFNRCILGLRSAAL